MPHEETLRLIQRILFKAFWIGFVLLILSAGLMFVIHDAWTQMVMQMWHINNLDALNMLVFGWYGLVKTLLIFGFLVPALAIGCALKCSAKCSA